MQLFEHQREFVARNPDKWLCMWEMGCLHGDTPIYDPVDGSIESVRYRSEYGKRFHVWSKDSNGNLVIAEAEAPIAFTECEMLRITFENGRNITVTPKHRFWNGESYVTAESLRLSSDVRLPSTLELYPSKSPEGVLHLKKTTEDSSIYYQILSHLYDRLLRLETKSDQFFSRLKDDALELSHDDYKKDDVGHKRGYIHLYRHNDPLATQDCDPRHYNSVSDGWLFRTIRELLLFFSRGHKISLLKNACLLRLYKALHTTIHQIASVCSYACKNDIIYLKIGKVETVQSSIYYDFHVPIYENYLAEGIIHHNTGKTLAAIEWAKKGSQRTLIIVPKMLRENWKRNLRTLNGLQQTAIISKEEFRRDWDCIDGYNQVVIDEAHYFFGHTSQMHKALVAYTKKHDVQRILALTATPYGQPWNVYGAAAVLGQPLNWLKFRKMFFYDVKMGHRTIPIVRPGIDSSLIEILRRFGNTVKLEDCVDMPEQVYETEWFDLTENQMERIRNAYDPLPIVRFTKEHQICGGTLKGDEYSEGVSFACPKSDRLEELITANERLIVVCRYLHEIEELSKRFAHIRPTYTLHGGTENRDAVIEDLKQRASYCLFVQAQCSEGWELPACPVMVFYSLSWRLVDFVQMCGRIRRINNPKRNAYIALVVSDTADEAIYRAIQHKQSFQAELYNAREAWRIQ